MTLAQILRAIGDGCVAASVPMMAAQPIVGGALSLIGRLASVAADSIDQGITDAELVAQLKRAKRIDTTTADASLDAEVAAKPPRS